MREISKADWKLFRERIPGWQERYMEKLAQEYIALLIDTNKAASDKFWTLEKKIKKDKNSPGVLINMTKSEAQWDIVRLLRDGAITMEDLKDFSDDLKEAVEYIIERYSE